MKDRTTTGMLLDPNQCSMRLTPPSVVDQTVDVSVELHGDIDQPLFTHSCIRFVWARSRSSGSSGSTDTNKHRAACALDWTSGPACRVSSSLVTVTGRNLLKGTEDGWEEHLLCSFHRRFATSASSERPQILFYSQISFSGRRVTWSILLSHSSSNSLYSS